MNVRIYVGNLPFRTTDAELRTLFEGYGEVESADVIRYKGSGRSKGYAFVQMDEEASEKAAAELNEKEYEGRMLKVRVAKPRENYPRKQDQISGDTKSMRIGID
ncbi:MAG: RNA-binding protein [Deltaproteobacteria bacterium]|nr:RNA-binding protein [Deltaproteobacteria bacterium]MBT4086927.1 RNA-binding protein [Deltaproteobacteria bacterium]MBT4266342.1 RNA-binding protein [Deltaproteobacteria bacterium]MBT4643974.1 RNA-binding protein [Deltaproteobacteria bacterium]MBT6502566.1 RNA-binding protein [Deltaproteobacteria bacterium]